MAHTKAKGSTRLGRDSRPKYLGIKRTAGEYVLPGHIIVRQRGTVFHPGVGVDLGKDFTLFASREGIVRFRRKRIKHFPGKFILRKYVEVVPAS